MPKAAASLNMFLALFAWGACAAHADEVTICYNYGCYAKAQVNYSDAQLESLQRMLAAAGDAATERTAISLVIGRMYAIAGEQTLVWRDKGGNYADRGENGQMDCIDHSTNTSTFLGLLQSRGWLRFHEVLDPVRRLRFFLAVHWSARVRDKGTQQVYVVDSWYVDNGHPAIVIPVEDWRSGNIPDGA
jgi:hypothetical protein